MSKNCLAVLIAAALISLSAAGMTYLSTRQEGKTMNTQAERPPSGSAGKMSGARAAVSVYGLPTRIAPGLLSRRATTPQSAARAEPSHLISGGLPGAAVGPDAGRDEMIEHAGTAGVQSALMTAETGDLVGNE